MSASCAAEIMYLSETNTGSSFVSESCLITEQYFDLMSLLIWVAGIVILLSLKESRSAAQSNFAPNAFIMLLSISIASGPRRGNTNVSTGKYLLPSSSAKQIYSKILMAVPLALRNNIASGGMGNTRLCRNFAWLQI